MMMNIGIDSSAKLSSLPKKISGISSSERMPSKISRKPAETISSPSATETPENSTKMVTMATTAPSEADPSGFLHVERVDAGDDGPGSAASCSSSRPKPTGMARVGIHSRTPQTVSDRQLRSQAACQYSKP
jgi:hypothetical protein